MSRLGDFLKKALRDKMEFHKRSATGEAVESLREEIKGSHLYIYGVDYWKEINEGTPAGTLIPLADIQRWAQAKEGRYSITLPAATAIQRRIYAKGAAINEEPEKLGISTQVVKENRSEITDLAEELVGKLLKLRG